MWLTEFDTPVLPRDLAVEEAPPVRDTSHGLALQLRGFDVRGVRPPTVPAGTARLRLSLTLNVDEAAITALLDALVDEIGAKQPWRSAS